MATKAPKAAASSDQIRSIAAPAPSGDAQQSGLWRLRAGQREQAIVARRLDLAHESAAELDEFAVERQAGEMRADDGDLDAPAHVTRARRVGRSGEAGRAHRRARARLDFGGEAGDDPSSPAGAISVTLDGRPSPRMPDGVAMAQRSSRLTKFV